MSVQDPPPAGETIGAIKEREGIGGYAREAGDNGRDKVEGGHALKNWSAH